jgi:CRP/FNR family transcriptional regulator, dissimilatory nitrate respiration regulator
MTQPTENRIDTEALLCRMPLFQDLPGERILELAEHSRAKRLPKGEMLFQKGDPAHGFFVVVYGQVKLAFPSSNGNEKVVDIIGAQQSFGEAVMLAQYPYPVFAQALADSLLVFIAREAVFNLLENEPAFARRMLIGLALHNHSLVHDIESYTQRTSSQRVIGYLLEHCPRDGGCRETIEILLPTSKQITASRLNLTPETLSRIFHDLAEAGLIEIEGKRIKIHSIQRLRAAITDGSVDSCHLAAANARPRVSRRPGQTTAAASGETRRHASHLPSTEPPAGHRLNPAYASW